ncbi:MAG: hypothetical protein WAK93_06050 [Solirubrobacteraceae bacterium]
MAKPPTSRWWQIRTAQNLKPATYRCPLCGERLPSMSPHMLIVPEGDPSRRRHAHTSCVLKARRRGGLPSRQEWLRSQRSADTGPDDGRWSRLRARLRGQGPAR